MKTQTMRAVLALALSCAFGVTAAASAGEAPKTQKKVQIDVPAPGAGLVAAVDPATGKFRQPTAAELKALSDQMSKMFRPATEATVTYYADGTVSADLGDSFMNMTILRINPDGSKSSACVESVDAAVNFFASAPAPAFEDR